MGNLPVDVAEVSWGERTEPNSWHMTNDTGKYQVPRNKNTLHASNKRVKNDGTEAGALMMKTGGRGHSSLPVKITPPHA